MSQNATTAGTIPYKSTGKEKENDHEAAAPLLHSKSGTASGDTAQRSMKHVEIKVSPDQVPSRMEKPMDKRLQDLRKRSGSQHSEAGSTEYTETGGQRVNISFSLPKKCYIVYCKKCTKVCQFLSA